MQCSDLQLALRKLCDGLQDSYQCVSAWGQASISESAPVQALEAQVASARAEGEAEVQSLNAVVKDLQSQLQLIQEILRPKETGSKRPRVD